MRETIKYFILGCLILVSFSCKINERTTAPRNLERIYDPASSKIHPEIKVYNYSDSISVLVENIKTSELLYNQANPNNELLSRVQVTYNLYDLKNRQNLVDSSTTTFKFPKNDEKKYVMMEIEVNSSIGNEYLLEIITTDLNRRNSQYSFSRIDRAKGNHALDFLYYDIETEDVLLDSYIRPDRGFGIKHYKKDIDSLVVNFYSYDFYTPLPPYLADTLSDQLVVSDTSWICYLDSIKFENFQHEGIYYFSEIDTYDKSAKGFVLYNFGEEYPKITTPKEIAEPIKYLGGIDTIPGKDSTGKLTKLAVDNFWLERTNNIDKSRELLKAYYNRVMLANKYFTSYKKGWQTDRGMIYVIYGLPDYLFKSGSEERWIYSPQGIGTGIEFIFRYQENPFSFNHYVLDREKLKMTGWDDAVQMWNEGKIIYFQNNVE